MIANAPISFADFNGDELLDVFYTNNQSDANYLRVQFGNESFPDFFPLQVNYNSNGIFLNWSPFPNSVACQIKGGPAGGNDPHNFIITGNEPSQKFINGNSLQVGQEYQWRVRCATGVNPYSGITPWSEYDYFTYNPLWDPDGENKQLTTEDLELKIYPNPSSDFTIISIENANQEMRVLEILDQQGRVVRTELMNENIFRLERNDLANGIYFLNLKTPNGQILKSEKLLLE